MKLNYKKSGVNIKAADQFVKSIKGAIATSAISKISAFGSLFDLNSVLKKYKNPILVSSTDGVGTKLKIAQSLDIHNTIGIDLVAMNVNDIICLGAKPLFFLDYIACGKAKPKVLKSIVSGITKGLKESDCVLLGGETAEMPGMYSAGEYDLAGFCVGIADRSKLINGQKIKQGDCVIGLSSSGFHSNGYSLVRKALGSKGIKKHAKALIVPTKIYVKGILALLDKVNVKGIAHITGGAFYNKATKILPNGLGMVINKKTFNVPEIFKVVAASAKVSEREMYTVFNMGIGMVVVVNVKQAETALGILNKYYKAQVIGAIDKSKKRMVLY
ncbi:MAG: phosphoribosylformylglycinamidine cyclo-ligase [Candidatus Omnitrophica bacterium]|nr:phosphoribosylformylglycinamidine cyclo-ligase [Candidatus Omnitrophota bacterium]